MDIYGLTAIAEELALSFLKKCSAPSHPLQLAFTATVFAALANSVLAETTYGRNDRIESFFIDSRHVDQTFEINVYVPPEYESASGDIPVLYFPDSDLFFDAITPLQRTMVDAGGLQSVGVPPMVLVGIGYPGNLEDSNWSIYRERDLLLWPDELAERLKTGAPELKRNLPKLGQGADDFLEFIRGELIPEIEKRYPNAAKDDRAYFGHSGGSWFGLYTLFSKPDTFHRYIVSSTFHVKGAIEYGKSGKRLDAHLFMSYGDHEAVEHWGEIPMGFSGYPRGMASLINTLQTYDFPGLKYSYRTWPDEVHLTSWVPSFMHGLRAVFPQSQCKPYLFPKSQRDEGKKGECGEWSKW